ncbi:MAG: purine-nucleoside phosphorylase [Clostridia bacterium]|nr:purine-nucleoside phosphorylase [Clostridia bacterium]
MFTFKQYAESVGYIADRIGDRAPDFLAVLGSGLGKLANAVADPVLIPYGDIPHFAVSTAMGHAGRFVAGELGGKYLLMMQGRFHMYEGWSAQQVAYPVRVAKLLGAGSMLITNAAGGVNKAYKPGDIMIIDDFIRLGFDNPLIGQNIDEFGERFCDMSFTFDQEYSALFADIARKNGCDVRRGVYYYASGPMYETPAEIRAIRALGADAVGMSTVHECIAANHCGMRILGLSLITNMAAGVLEQKLSGDEVIEVGNAASDALSALVNEFMARV